MGNVEELITLAQGSFPLLVSKSVLQTTPPRFQSVNAIRPLRLQRLWGLHHSNQSLNQMPQAPLNPMLAEPSRLHDRNSSWPGTQPQVISHSPQVLTGSFKPGPLKMQRQAVSA